MPKSGKILLLWDVDHTLIENSGVSKETYALAYQKLGNEAPSAQPGTDGRTDYEIMRNLFEANGTQAPSDATIETALLSAGKELAGELLTRGYVLPGVHEVLERVSATPAIVQSALTGNLRPNAENKLALLGGTEHLLDLEVGAFGSDHIVRSRLVSVAQERATAKYGFSFERSTTVLVGDTVRDIAAAHTGGALIVAVATGVAGEQELRDHGADTVVPDLSDTDAFMTEVSRLTGHVFNVA